MTRRWSALTLVAAAILATPVDAEETASTPFVGITHIVRTETSPRSLKIHVVKIDLTAPSISFKVTPPGGTRETVRQTTLDYIVQERAQVAINAHFFLPYPSSDLNASLIGTAASNGLVFSAFEQPAQNYALVTDAPGLNIDSANNATIVHKDPTDPSGVRALESVRLWNTVAGSAQIVTNGVKTIPCYVDAGHPACELVGPGPAMYSNANSWYSLINARTAIGLSQDGKTMVMLTVDSAGGSQGMSVGEVADMLIRDYAVYNALNLDGGGSTTLAMEDPVTHARSLVNTPSGGAARAVGSSLAVFASPVPPIPTYQLTTGVSPAGSGTMTPATGKFYPAGSSVPLKATPNTGYTFKGWTGDAKGSNAQTSITMSGPLAVTATFIARPTTLSASVSSKSGSTSARVWKIKLSNSGPGAANAATVDGVTLTRTSGSACTPVITMPASFPLAVGNIAPGSSQSASVTIAFAGCSSGNRYSVRIAYSANAGVTSGSTTLTKQSQ